MKNAFVVAAYAALALALAAAARALNQGNDTPFGVGDDDAGVVQVKGAGVARRTP